MGIAPGVSWKKILQVLSIIETLLKSMQNAPGAPGDSSSTFLYIESMRPEIFGPIHQHVFIKSLFKVSGKCPWSFLNQIIESSVKPMEHATNVLWANSFGPPDKIPIKMNG